MGYINKTLNRLYYINFHLLCNGMDNFLVSYILGVDLYILNVCLCMTTRVLLNHLIPLLIL